MSDDAGVGFFKIIGALILAYNIIMCLISPVLLFTLVSAPSITAILISIGYSCTIVLPGLVAILAHKSVSREQKPETDYYGRLAWAIMIIDILLGVTLSIISAIKFFSGTLPELGIPVDFTTIVLPICTVSFSSIIFLPMLMANCPNDAINIHPQSNVLAAEEAEEAEDLLDNQQQPDIAPDLYLAAQQPNTVAIPVFPRAHASK